MKIKDLFGLDSELLVKWMRESGVQHLGAEGYSITLGPSVQGAAFEPSRFEDDESKEKLLCGHTVWEANELGECLHGCVPPKEDK